MKSTERREWRVALGLGNWVTCDVIKIGNTDSEGKIVILI
jgi:hypothetical protein